MTETIDMRVGADPRAPGSRFQFLDQGQDRVVDPDTGEVLLDLTDEQATELYTSATTFDGAPAPNFTLADFTPSDLWVASVRDGTWLLHDLAEPSIDENGHLRRPAAGLIARVGDVLLVETGDRWLRLDAS